jgi:glycosyltransferase involved in cell wall biosynthesis
MDNISVIIRNKNEEQYIGFAIQSVIDHFDSPEIVIVDNNSTDRSLEIVSLFRPILKENLRIININNYSPGAALNEGIKNCNNDIVLILSAHSQITHMNLINVKNLLNHHQSVMGQQNPIYCGKKISKRYIWSHFNDTPCVNMYSKIESRQFLHNAFCFYKKKTLLDHPFDEILQGKEDRYWAIDAVDRGDSYWYDPTIKANHYWTPNGATWKGIG